MKVKTRKRYHYITIRMIKIQSTDKTKFWTGCETIDTHSLLVEMHNDTVIWKTVWPFFTKLNTPLNIGSINRVPCNLHKGVETFVLFF